MFWNDSDVSAFIEPLYYFTVYALLSRKGFPATSERIKIKMYMYNDCLY